MANEITLLLQKVSAGERSNGLMNTFQALSTEEQVSLMEWSRSICMQLSSMLEKQDVMAASGRTESIDLPAAKMYLEIAIKVGVIRASFTKNEELMTGCERIYPMVFGETKYKVVEKFKEVVSLALQLSHW